MLNPPVVRTLRLATLCRANSDDAAFGFKCKPLHCIRSRSHLQLLLLQQRHWRSLTSVCLYHVTLCAQHLNYYEPDRRQDLFLAISVGGWMGGWRPGKAERAFGLLQRALPSCLGKRVLRPICSLTRKTNWTISQMDGAHSLWPVNNKRKSLGCVACESFALTNSPHYSRDDQQSNAFPTKFYNCLKLNMRAD